mmetsp:Transcript_19904/g.28316  ORF Transcript_19904/g.28316 Transcript_19904/m.28316 type:complete len:221 (-) Transcript_19904:119-781(-)
MTMNSFETTGSIHRRFAAAIALYTTFFVIWIENVKGLVCQQRVTTIVSDFFQKSLSSSKFSFSVGQFKSVLSMNSLRHAGASFFIRTPTTGVSKTTSSLLHMASYIGDFATDKPILQTSTFRSFQSWYNIVDPRIKGPVYNEIPADFSFPAPQHTWPPLLSSDSSDDEDFYIEDEDNEDASGPELNSAFPPESADGWSLPARALNRIAPWAFRSFCRSSL